VVVFPKKRVAGEAVPVQVNNDRHLNAMCLSDELLQLPARAQRGSKETGRVGTLIYEERKSRGVPQQTIEISSSQYMNSSAFSSMALMPTRAMVARRVETVLKAVSSTGEEGWVVYTPAERKWEGGCDR
jgi:hypothetical protein